MRDWNPDPKDYADILVSELLGSFGDNELRYEDCSGYILFRPDNITEYRIISLDTGFSVNPILFSMFCLGLKKLVYSYKKK